jgi:adenylate kinase
MRLILLGPPGSGKGTQAKLLCERHRLEHISTGDLLRAARDHKTPLGLQAQTFMSAGQLVPDTLVNDLIAERFRGPNRPVRFVMDGYPRTRAQAVAFDALLQEQKLPLDAAVLLTVPDEAIVERIIHRRSCPNPTCRSIYHTVTNPPKVPGICDRCGTGLIQRDDDREETVRKRLAVYHHDTAEVIPYYRERGLLREVAGLGDIEVIYANLMRVLGTQAGRTC